MKSFVVGVLMAVAVPFAAAQVTVADFTAAPSGSNLTVGLSWLASATPQFTAASGILSVGPVGGGTPTSTGYFAYADIVTAATPLGVNTSGYTNLDTIVRVDSGNAATSFNVILYDSGGQAALFATFSVSSLTVNSWNTVSSSLQAASEGGNPDDIAFFGIAGNGSSQIFNMSFDKITLTSGSAVPEPSTYAAILGAMVLGFVAYRRRVAA